MSKNPSDEDKLAKDRTYSIPEAPSPLEATPGVVQGFHKASCIFPYFKRSNDIMVVLAVAGDHYFNTPHDHNAEPLHTLFGGFREVDDSPEPLLDVMKESVQDRWRRLFKTTYKAANKEGRRELHEELCDEKGNSLFPRLLNSSKIRPFTERSAIIKRNGSEHVLIVSSFAPELTQKEIEKLETHIKRIDTDPDYHAKVMQNTINPHSGKPEIYKPVVVNLKDVLDGKYTLLHKGHRDLFKALGENLQRKSTPGVDR